MTRLFFCTDLHGSEVCFKKFLSAGKVYEAGTIIMGGDCTGKMVIPLIENGNGGYFVSWAGGDREVTDADDLAELETQIKNNGLYPVRMSDTEQAALHADPDRLAKLFTDVMTSTLGEWLVMAEERLGDSGIQVIFTPGNDDEFAVDDVIAASDFVEGAEGRIVRVDDYEMLSLGWANPTPWDTPRETTEEDLYSKIEALAEQIEDMDRAIFNIHVPPYGTGLDDAPELADEMTRKSGGTLVPVGSTAVRDAILKYQPMLSLHGHIHESRGSQKLGRTIAINPGSTYSDWSLQGVIVDIDDGAVARQVPTTG